MCDTCYTENIENAGVHNYGIHSDQKGQTWFLTCFGCVEFTRGYLARRNM